MAYADGFIVPVPRRKLAAYKKMAKKAARIWREYGALDYKECVADDVKWGRRTSFPRSIKQKPNETVVLSWIVYRSRKHRDSVNKKIMRDKRLDDMMQGEAVFDGKRMIYGGFEVLVSF